MMVFLAKTVTLQEAARSDNPIFRVLLRGQSADQLTGLTGRVELWRAALPMFFERPALGYGYHGARPILLRYASWAGYTHNAYLQTLLDLGLAGALLVWPVVGWLLVTSILRRIRDATPTAHHSAFVLGTAAFIILNSVTSESFAGTPGYEVLLLFACTGVASQMRLAAPVRLSAAMRGATATHRSVVRPGVHVSGA